MRPAVLAAVCLLVVAGLGCRRENPAPRRTATAAAAQAISQQATATVAAATAVVEATAAAAAGPTAAKLGKLVSGGGSGLSAGIQIWSKPGGVLAGGATMAGMLPDGASVEVVRSDEFMGQRYHQVRGTGGESGKEGWVEARFVQLQ